MSGTNRENRHGFGLGQLMTTALFLPSLAFRLRCCTFISLMRRKLPLHNRANFLAFV